MSAGTEIERSCASCLHLTTLTALGIGPVTEPCRSCLRVDGTLQSWEPKGAAAPDPVSHPAHYTQGKVECIDAIEAATTGLEGPAAFLAGTAIKYLWRWHHKRKPLEDLRKARWYLDRLIKHQEQAEGGRR